MSYRCQVCDHQVEPGQQRLTHIVTRDLGSRTEIEREMSVCKVCKAMLDAGMPMVVVERMRGKIIKLRGAALTKGGGVLRP